LSSNRWCPTCAANNTEKYVKHIVELLLNKRFIKIRPQWLVNNDNNKLEIDIYNDELKLGFEYYLIILLILLSNIYTLEDLKSYISVN